MDDAADRFHVTEVFDNCNECECTLGLHCFFTEEEIALCRACAERMLYLTSSTHMKLVDTGTMENMYRFMETNVFSKELGREFWLENLSSIHPKMAEAEPDFKVIYQWEEIKQAICEIVCYDDGVKETPPEIFEGFLKKKFYTNLNPLTNGTDNIFTKIIKKFRAVEDFCYPVRVCFSKALTSLIVLSYDGVYTPFHMDWSEAKNIAVGIEGTTDIASSVATWYFVVPEFISDVLQHFNTVQGSFMSEDYDANSGANLKAACAQFHKANPEKMIRVRQLVGTPVIVPP